MSGEDDLPFSMDVVPFGKKFFNLSRNSAYAAAARGDFVIAEIGKLKKVIIAPTLQKLAGEKPKSAA
jgi:hypothetical protein